MGKARLALAVLAVVAAAASAPHAAAQASGVEADVRAALARCVEAWNRHQPKAFGDACLTEDVWFSETDDSFYKRFQGREKVLGAFGYNIESADLQWDVVRLKGLPDGTVAAELKQRIGILPRKPDGSYSQTFDSDPSFARLRRDGGAWKVSFFTSHRGWARSLLQALDKPAPAPVAAAPAPTHATSDAPVPPGVQPPAYSMQFGAGLSCFYCHGNRPTLSEDGTRARIVASGAAAESAAALRQAMATPRAGGIMDNILADPALTDERLDAIRLWLRTLRDGHAEQQADRIVIRNQRSERDPPVRLALLRAEGGWRLPPNAGCRQGAALKGGAQCEIRLPPGSRGTLLFRFAKSGGLEPQPVRLPLDER